LADVIPTRVTVAATAAEAKSIRLVARLQASVAKQRHRFGVKVRNLRRQIATAHELQALEGSVSESRGISQAADRKLQKDLDSMSRRLSGDWYDGLIWLGAGFVLGALLILLFVRHRRSQDEDVGFPATVPSTIEFVEESPRDELMPVG